MSPDLARHHIRLPCAVSRCQIYTSTTATASCSVASSSTMDCHCIGSAFPARGGKLRPAADVRRFIRVSTQFRLSLV
ncbi:hypothetical protein BU16DRAFT_199391 [Lophium mytilinum]|uniref:Uncharacterized protein n=1 Tax=Lophium mytilinum TaxID=390894 RepID=A0A6A6RCH5_9PEZI|nr:hypothetical protein BU16DRAFT_199391 [Lophium mytilinum]